MNNTREEYKKFIDRMKIQSNYEKWVNLGRTDRKILKDISNLQKPWLTLILENQKLMNEQYDSDPILKRNLISIIKRIYGDSPISRLVGLQALLSNIGFNWQLVNGEMKYEESCAITKRLKTSFKIPERKSCNAMDDECEMIFSLTESISTEICREITNDLCNNVDTIKIGKCHIHSQLIIDKMNDVANEIHNDCKHAPTWILVSPEMLLKFALDGRFRFSAGLNETIGFYSAGIMTVGNDTMEVFCDNQFKNNKILFGYCSGNPVDSGYYYMPYIPLSISKWESVNPNNDKFCENVILTRYAKRLRKDGKKYYRILEI